MLDSRHQSPTSKPDPAEDYNLWLRGLGFTWTPKVCRIMAFYRFWAIILPILGGSGRGLGFRGLAV